MQSRYSGRFLYLIKHSHPDTANVARELSESMDSATMAAYKEMLRVTKFVLDTASYCLEIEPKASQEDWD
jgi:hypothetical protein